MAISIVGLLLLGVLAFVAIGYFTLAIGLSSKESTRAVGRVMLLVPAFVIVIGIAGLAMMFVLKPTPTATSDIQIAEAPASVSQNYEANAPDGSWGVSASDPETVVRHIEMQREEMERRHVVTLRNLQGQNDANQEQLRALAGELAVEKGEEPDEALKDLETTLSESAPTRIGENTVKEDAIPEPLTTLAQRLLDHPSYRVEGIAESPEGLRFLGNDKQEIEGFEAISGMTPVGHWASQTVFRAAKRPKWANDGHSGPVFQEVAAGIHDEANAFAEGDDNSLRPEFWAIRTDPERDFDDSLRAMPALVREKAAQFAREQLGMSHSDALLAANQLSDGYIHDNMIDAYWVEPVDSSYGVWVRSHALVKIDHGAMQAMQDNARRQAISTRLTIAIATFGALLITLTGVFLYMLAMRKTGGEGRWRLRIAFALGILLLVGTVLGGLMVVA